MASAVNSLCRKSEQYSGNARTPRKACCFIAEQTELTSVLQNGDRKCETVFESREKPREHLSFSVTKKGEEKGEGWGWGKEVGSLKELWLCLEKAVRTWGTILPAVHGITAELNTGFRRDVSSAGLPAHERFTARFWHSGLGGGFVGLFGCSFLKARTKFACLFVL